MRKQVVLWILIGLNLAVIFFFSHQNSKASGALSSNLTSQIKIHTPHYAEKTQAQQKVVHTRIQYLVRGLAHGCLFGSLGILTFLLWRSYSKKWVLPFLGNLVIGFLIAISDETHQRFVPGRSFGWDDILYDVSGFLMGMALVILWELILIWHQKKSAKK